MKRTFVLLSVSLILVFALALPCFAYDGRNGKNDYVAGHNGYTISVGQWMYGFNNALTNLTTDTLYEQGGTSTTLYGTYTYLQSQISYPSVLSNGSIVTATHQAFALNNLTTLYFDTFSPSLLYIDNYSMFVVGAQFDTTAQAHLTYDVVYEDSTSYYTDSHEFYFDVDSNGDIEINLFGSLSDAVEVRNLTIEFPIANGYGWLYLDFPVVLPSTLNYDFTDNIHTLPPSDGDLVTVWDTVIEFVDNFLDIEIYGSISIGTLLGAILSILLALWFLRLLAGG